MEIRSDSLDFSSPTRGSGPRLASKTIVFPRSVVSAVAGLSGYLTEFSGRNDHHVGRLDVRLATTTDDNTVTVEGRLGLRDWSGSWDDDYDGVIDFVVLAELESAAAPPRRRDLAITGVEFNQATQFFRANRFLDLVNAHPDNSVFLIENKNTGIRVYGDWDAGAGLAPIAALSGELVVSSASSTVTLQPINPGGAIVPKRDAAINQALPNDTLNFMIPSALSAGSVTVTCRLFDQAAPATTSGQVTRTLVFVPVEPLNIFLVGITTVQPPAAAPSQSAIASAMALLNKTYPRGTVQVTGFTTTTLNSQIVGSSSSSGCGAGWGELLDLLRDLRGGSDDVYFGGLPAGIFAAGTVGCSPVGDRIAASFIDLPITVPHEVGHSLGRSHAPCVGCSPPAQDPDPNFPQYNTFPSDSIGVFGFDPTTNSVFNPATTLDFMTAFLPSSAWISPYTHQALLGPIQGGLSPSGALTHLRGTRMTLFLGLDISRDRTVTRRTSFHHPAPIQGGTGCATPFSYELLDEKEQPLDCGPLHCPCAESRCDCWPQRVREAIPYPPDARWLVVWEGDAEIYREPIPDPPDVRITDETADKDGVRLAWEADGDDLLYLVHVWDDKSEQYRGLVPRQTETSVTIPKRLFTHRGRARVRVLASSGIATGVAEVEVRMKEPAPADVSLTLLGGERQDNGETALPPVVSVLATLPSGRQIPGHHVSWYDDNGNRVGRGEQLDLRSLPRGTHVVRAVARGAPAGATGAAWAIEHHGFGFRLEAAVNDSRVSRKAAAHKHPHAKPKPKPDQSAD